MVLHRRSALWSGVSVLCAGFRTAVLAAALATAAMHGAASAGAAEPARRIVSLNLCTDQLVLALAPDQIAALSRLAADPRLSSAAAEAARHPAVGADAEAVLTFDPDLIVAAPFTAFATVDLLRRLGRRVFIAPAAQDVDGLKAAFRELGGQIGGGAVARAEEVVQALEARLTAAADLTARHAGDRTPSALVLNYGGIPSGPGWPADTALRLAGYRNAAADYAANARGAVPLEAIVARPPDLLVLGQDARDYRTVQADNLRHPALADLMTRVPSLHLPQRLTLCATPEIADAVERLAARRPVRP